MAGKFGIAFILVCTLFIQSVAFNASGSNLGLNPSGQNTTVLNTAVSSPCSVDQDFYVSSGVSKPDPNFGVSPIQPGIDAGFKVPVCKGVSVPDPNAPGGQ